MRLFTIFIAFSILFTAIPGIYAAGKTPSSSDVKEELRSLLENHAIKDVETYKKRLKIPVLFSIPPLIIKILLYMILVSLFITLIIGLYHIIKSDGPGLINNKTAGNKEITEKEINISSMPPFEKLYMEAISFAEEGDHNKAVILLHQATIEYLAEALMIQRGREYTNNDLKRVAKNQTHLYEPFCYITRHAEIAAFSNFDLNKEDFTAAEQNFKKGFL